MRMKRGREWTPAVVVKRQQAPRSNIVATPDGTQMSRNRFHLQPIKEEASPATRPAREAVASDESNPRMQPNTDVGIETPEMGSHAPQYSAGGTTRQKKYSDSKTTTASY